MYEFTLPLVVRVASSGLPDDDGLREMDALTRLVKHTVNLQSVYKSTAEDFQVEYRGCKQRLVLKTLPDLRKDIFDSGLLRAAALLSLRESLKTGDTHYQSLLGHDGVPESVKSAIIDLRQITGEYDVARIYEQIETEWTPNTSNSFRRDVVVLYIIWALSAVRPHHSVGIYEKANSCLAMAGSFLLCYLASGCLKLETVNRMYPELHQTRDQFQVMQLFSTFKDLPGLDW